MSEKKKHRVIIGIELSLLCMILATLSINAVSFNPPSNGVSYNKNNQVTVQNALDDLYNKANYGNATASQILKGRTALVGGKQVTGTYEAPTLASQTPGDATAENIDEGKIAWVNGEKIVGIKKTPLAQILRLGDYISYTPNSTSYTISKERTGYSSDQTINPSELNVWRVIRKNEDETVDIVSVNASSSQVTFSNTDGFNNFLGVLGSIASVYRTTGYTVRARYTGESDLVYIEEVLGTDHAKRVGSDSVVSYWIAKSGNMQNVSQSFLSASVVEDGSGGATVFSHTNICDSNTSNCYRKYTGSGSRYLRPIVVLKSDLKITGGDGTESNPYTLGI